MLPTKSKIFPTISRFFDDEWNSLFDWSNRNISQPTTTLPSVNIKENADSFIVEVAAPGMKKDDFQIELDNNLLIIKHESKKEQATDNANYQYKEFSYQSFQRSFNLNHEIVNAENITAEYVDGILSISISKKEEKKLKPVRMIEIT